MRCAFASLFTLLWLQSGTTARALSDHGIEAVATVEAMRTETRRVRSKNGTHTDTDYFATYAFEAQTEEGANPALLRVEQQIAVALQASVGEPGPGPSVAVPTWHYGHEPFTPLATHIAKYFQNSIREDGLLALAADGVIFAEGKAGTLQEVFQDAAQNYYTLGDRFSPMVFLGKAYWSTILPVRPLIERLFSANGKEGEYRENVLYTDSVEEAIAFVTDRPFVGAERALMAQLIRPR